MLKITPYTSASAAKWYFTGNRHEYYSELNESVGTWKGKGANRLGLHGEVSTDAFGALCDNLHPIMGSRLTARTKENRRIGYDLTFSPPKSVSIVHAFSRDQRIVQALEESADAAMLLVEADAKTRVRRGNQDIDRVTGELTWARFTHLTTRPVNGIPDPQLHIHCFAFNATFDGEERRWKAAQLGDIKATGAFYQTAFHTELGRRLEALGFSLTWNEKSFEIAGIPEHLIHTFSRRRKQIDDYANERGITSKRTRELLALMTREAKRHDLTPQHLHEEWASRITPDELALILACCPTQPQLDLIEHDPELENKAISYAMHSALERQSVIDERLFLEAAMRFGKGKLDIQRLRDRVTREPGLIRNQHEGCFVITTPQVIAEEQQMIAWVKAGRHILSPLARGHVPSAKLSDDQRRAVQSVLNSRDRMTAVIGKAGTGKTFMMQEAIAAIRSNGVSVQVCAPNSDTAHNTLLTAGFTDAVTLRAFLEKVEIYERARGGVIWIDEAGLVAQRDMVALMELADKIGARVILSGDTRQHRPVERGDALRILTSHTDLETVTLEKNQRQQGIYREIVDHLSEGQLLEAFTKMDAAGMIYELPGPERYDFIAGQYLKLWNGPGSVQIVSPTHSEGRKVTEAVRAALKQNGHLNDERQFVEFRRVDLLDADKQRPAAYQPGWVVEMIRSKGGYRAGERLTVSHINDDGLFVQHADGRSQRFDTRTLSKQFQVYQRETIDLAPGDRLRISKNGLDPSRRRLVNSTLHTVTGFTDAGDIQLDNGRVVPRDFGHIAHGYVTTSYVAQSKTVQHVIIAVSTESFGAVSREQQYVSTSRGRIAPTLVTDTKAGLFEACDASSHRLAALDLDRPSPPVIEPKPVQQRLLDQLGTLPMINEQLRIRLSISLYSSAPGL